MKQKVFFIVLLVGLLFFIACKYNSMGQNGVQDESKVTLTFYSNNDKLGSIIALDNDEKTLKSNSKIEKDCFVVFKAKIEGENEIYQWKINDEVKYFYLHEIRLNITEDTRIEAVFRDPHVVMLDDISFELVSITEVNNIELGYDYIAENRIHTLSLSPYLICKTEVTRELYERVMKDDPSASFTPPNQTEIQGKRPVERVTWFDAIAFCNELTCLVDGTNSQCVYEITNIEKGEGEYPNRIISADVKADWSKRGFRLPTEAEWEVAARSGKNTKWAETDDESELPEYAWYKLSSKARTHQVALLKPNSYGLYDMTGNVWEWCWDLYENITEDGQDFGKDYKGANSGTDRSYRGGGFINPKNPCSIGHRAGGFEPKMAVDSLGLRIVRKK